jgi:four helix bundle protein
MMNANVNYWADMMDSQSVIRKKSYAFAIRIVRLAKYLCSENKEYVLSKQVLRSGTAIGALVRESEYAESTLDFIHKLRIARKEANETHYWLSLLKDTEIITPKMFESIIGECEELIKILTASIKTSIAKQKLQKSRKKHFPSPISH